LSGIHAAAQFVAGSPKGGIKVGFLNGHEERMESQRMDGEVIYSSLQKTLAGCTKAGKQEPSGLSAHREGVQHRI
jgi:hypothetical protein